MADLATVLTPDSFMASQQAKPALDPDSFMKQFAEPKPAAPPKQTSLFPPDDTAAREMARQGLPAPAPAGQAPKPEVDERSLTATLGQMAKDQAQGLYHAATTPLPEQFHQILGTGEHAPTMRELYDQSMPALVDKAKSSIDTVFGRGTVDRLPQDFPWIEFAGNLANEAARAGMSILDFGTTPAGMAVPEATTIPMALRPAVGAGIATSMVPGTVEAVKEAAAKPSSETIPKAIVQTAVNALPIAATVPFLRTAKDVFDERIAEHNAQAATLVEQERVAGRQLDIAQEVHGEPVPVEINGKPHAIELAGVNEKTGRPIFQVVNQENGKPVFMGYGPNTQDFLRSKEALPEKPEAPTEATPPNGLIAPAPEPGQAQTTPPPGIEPSHPEVSSGLIPPISKGSVFEGESGKYTVDDVQNGKVKFTAETKAGNVSGTMKLQSFTKQLQDQGLMPQPGAAPSASAGTSQTPAPAAAPAPVAQPPQAAPEGTENQADLTPDTFMQQTAAMGERPAPPMVEKQQTEPLHAQTNAVPELPSTDPEAMQLRARQELIASLSAKQPENLPMPSEVAKSGKSGSVEDLVRGSADVHLSQAGHEQANERGKQLVENLGYGQPGDILVTGGLTRAKQTGAHILEHAPDVHVLPANDELDTWGLGHTIEGKPTNDKTIKEQIRDLVEKHPDQVPEQGEGGVSTRPAESFNQFKGGFLQGGLQPLMQAYEQAPADAKPMVVAVIHGRGVRVTKGWEAKGTPADNSIDNSFMLNDNDKPGEIYRFAPDNDGKWKLSDVDPAKKQARQPGILLVRHAETPWNKTDTATRGHGDAVQKPEPEQAQTTPLAGAPTTLPEVKGVVPAVPELTPDSFMEQQKPSENRIPFTLGGGGYLVENKAAQRIQAFFKGKPPVGVRSQLKAKGFKWAPSISAWQRLLSPNALVDTARLFNVNMNPNAQRPAQQPAEPKEAQTETPAEQSLTHPEASSIGSPSELTPDSFMDQELSSSQSSKKESILEPNAEPVPTRATAEAVAANQPKTGPGTAQIRQTEPDAGPPSEPGTGRVLASDREGVESRPGEGTRAGGTRTTAGAELRGQSSDYRITDTDKIGEGGLRQKANDNLAAIRVLKQIEAEGRVATPEEQKALVKYVGWGGMPQPFAPYGIQREWQGTAEELKQLLTPEEFESARASTPNAHYTSPMVIKGMWDALEHLGLSPENISLSVLEPAMGVGHFYGLMPPELADISHRAGVELDKISGRISQLLYPKADVHIAGFEQVKMPDSFFDVAISNVPFGNYAVHDPAYKRNPLATRSIHDYFFAKALDKVRPGGIVAFVTSSFTMDKRDGAMRKYLSDRADLLGAIRLPNTAFKGNAGTEVTTDIIFLQKRAPQTPAKGEPWTELGEVPGTTKRPDGSRGTAQIPVNEYYARHPEMMMGKMGLEGTMYGPEKSSALIGDLTPEGLAKAIANLPAGAFTAWESPTPQFTASSPEMSAPDSLKEGAYTVKTTSPGGKVHHTVMRNEGGQLRPADIPAAEASRVMGMIEIRDAMRKVFDTQFHDAPEKEVTAARNHLNKVYDFFVRKNGYLSTAANVRAFKADPDSPSLLALEEWNADEKKATKAAIFTQRTIDKYRPADKADSAQDALSLSLNERGRIDWARMQELTGRTPEEMRSELGPLVYQNPAGKNWETADEYLSGNVRKKLADAQAAGKAFARNVEALKAVQPTDLHPEEIEARLGASWIPKEDVRQFVAELLDLPMRSVSIGHSDALASWSVDLGNKQTVANTKTYGTERYYAHELIQDALNLKSPTVYDTVGSGADERRVINEQQTLAAREMQEQIKDRFKEWAWGNPERSDRLAKGYNEEFNSDRLWQPDGSHLSMPGMSAAIKLKPHQKNVIWRALRGSNVLLAHVVGAGKTFEMIGIAKESRRLGLAKKPMMIVPKNRVDGTAAEFLRMYPAANILVMSSEDFTPKNRQKLMGRIATGNWDSVIVSYESFEKLPVSDETFNEYLRDQISDLENYILEAKSDKMDAKIVKELEKSKKRLEAKLRGKSDRESKDTGLTFEELGVDQLLVDEADNFKNLFFPTKMTRVAGIPNTESKRAFDMYIKTQHVAKRNGGRGIIFATGTPIANTMAEMYTMQRYLQPEWLRDHGLQHFDAWAQTFGQVVPSLEISPDASGMRMTNRFAKFVNIPELSLGFRNIADVQTAEMLNLPVPKVRGGTGETVAVPASDQQKEYIQNLAKRAKDIKDRKVKPNQDNMLKLSTDGRKAALDMRLVDPNAPDHPGSKLNAAVSKVFEVWKQGEKDRTTQLVFIDFSRPSQKGEANRFSVPDDMKAKLVAKGIPANEIAFAQSAQTDAQKEKLYKDVNAGSIRVLFGSTPTLGVGVNVQKKLIAAHHLDAPYRPRDVEQREGRIVRQGNTNDEVQIYRYVTQNSFDARMWDILRMKAYFIGQVMKGDSSIRTAEDISDVALSYAEVAAIASGSPAIREKTVVDAEVRKLDSLRARHEQQQAAVKREMQSLPQTIDAAKAQLSKIESDIKTRDAEPFQVTVGKQKFSKKEDRKEAAEAIQKALEAHRGDEKALYNYGFESHLPVIGTYRGLKVQAYYNSKWDLYTATLVKKPQNEIPLPDIRLEATSSYLANTNQEGNADGTMRSIESAVTRMERDAERASDTIAKSEKQLADIEELAGKPFDKAAKLKDLLAKQKELAKQLQTDKPDPQAMGAELPNDHPEDLNDLQAIKEGSELKRPAPTVVGAAEAKEGGPISEYTPGTGKLPTPESRTGVGKKGWMHGELEGRPLYSNGHILLEGEAPGVKQDTEQAGIAKVMTPASAPKPIQPAAFSKETKDTPPLVWFNDGTAVNSKYYDHAVKRFPDATFSLAKQPLGSQAVYMQEGGKTVGVIMPVRVEPSPTVKEILKQFVSSELGESNLPINIATLGTAKLIQEDLKPALKSAVHTLRGAKDDIQRLLAPASRKGAKPGALVLRESGAELARRTDIAMKALEGAQKYFAKRSPDENYDFIDKIENGEKQNTPEEDFIAQMFRDILDERRDEVQALGTGKLQNFNENYFPHIWEKPDQAADWVKAWYGKRPLEGGKAFLKKRKIPTIKEGLEAGLTPVSDNPVDLVLAKTREMDKYILAHQALDDLKDKGLLKYVSVSKQPEDGWALINDPVATVWGPRTGAVRLPEEANIAPEEVGVIGRRIMGHYYAPEPVATLVNNYLSPGLRDKSGLFRAYLGVGNMLNQFQLGFSAFHLAFTALDSATSKFALGVYQAAHGHPLKGLASIAQTPVAPFSGMVRGSKMLKEWYEPGTQGAEIGKLVDAMVKAGGRAKMDAFYRTRVTDRMLATLRRGNVLGAAIRAPFALVEQAARPVLDYAVPRMKMAVFADLARFELERLGPKATTQDAQAALARAWDSVDNRMGQLVYDNLFWHKTLKDLAMASVRSVGWNTGTIREIGGALADFAGEGAKAAGGKPPDFTPRMSYAVALPIVVGLLGALLTYLWTGRGPQKLIDYYYPKDQQGHRWALPSYIKDIHAYGTEPLRTLRNKVHPLLTLIGEMLSNRDYYDKPIMNPHHPMVKQAQEALKHIEKSFSPIPFRQFTEPKPGQGKSLPDKILPFVGVTPAPKSVEHPWTQREQRQRYY